VGVGEGAFWVVPWVVVLDFVAVVVLLVVVLELACLRCLAGG
jgi:hypothetical protein